MASLAAVMLAPRVFAAMNVTLVDSDGITSGLTYSYGVGGEFRAAVDAGLQSAVDWAAYSPLTSGTLSDKVDAGSWGYNQGLAVAGTRYFQTFCIEYTEEFTPGVTYSVGISGNALYGHVGQAPGVPVTMGTAWLYSEFASGGLSTAQNGSYNYTYGSGRSASAAALQQAIWYFQGEQGGNANSPFVAIAENALNGANNAFNAANGAYGVEALNLGAPGKVQDQLVIVPEGTTVIAGLGAFCLVLVGAVHRKSSVLRIG